MWLIYAPEDGAREEWWFDPQKMRAREAEAIEKRTGWDWMEFGQHLVKGSALARRALLWTYLRRVHHTLRFEDVDFSMEELTLEYAREELERLRAQVAEEDMAEAERSSALLALDAELVTAREAPGKAPASSDA